MMAFFIPTMALYVMAAYLIRAPRSLSYVQGSLKFDKAQALNPWQGSGLLFFRDMVLASVSIWFCTTAFPEMRDLFLIIGAAYGLLLIAKVLAGKDVANLQDGLVYQLTNPRIMTAMAMAVLVCGLPDSLFFIATCLIMTVFLLLTSLFTTLSPIGRKTMQNSF